MILLAFQCAPSNLPRIVFQLASRSFVTIFKYKMFLAVLYLVFIKYFFVIFGLKVMDEPTDTVIYLYRLLYR